MRCCYPSPMHKRSDFEALPKFRQTTPGKTQQRGASSLRLTSSSARPLLDESRRTDGKLAVAGKLINEGFSIESGIGDRCTFRTRTFNRPFPARGNQAHLVPLPPPAIHVTRNRKPHVMFRAEPLELSKELLVNVLFTAGQK